MSRILFFLLLLSLLVCRGGMAQAAPLFADVRVNGQLVEEAANFEQDGVGLSLNRQQLDRFGLVIPAGATGPTVPLSSLPGVRYGLDAATQTVSIEAEPSALVEIRMRAGPPDETAPAAPQWGTVVNYAYYGLLTDQGSSVSGLVEARVFGPKGSATTSFAVGGPGGSARRLDTAFVRDDPDQTRSLVVGDFVSNGPTWTRAVRAAGISLATDFDLRPGLITQPMPRIQGAAGTPSAVDVYFDNVRRYSGKTNPGPFSVDDLPMVDGKGQVSLVVTDVLGRQTVQSFPFYASGSLLKPGLSAYALEAGFLREDYAGPGDRYTDGFVSAALRHGLTDHLTFEAQADLSRRASTAGAGLVVNADEEALFAAAFSASSASGRIRPQVTFSARRDTRLYSLFASLQAGSGSYHDLAWRVDAPPVRRSVQAGASVNTGWGSFSASYNRLKTEISDNEIFGLGWSRNLGRVSFYASALETRRSSKAHILRLGFSLPLGRQTSGGGSVSSGAGGPRTSASASSAVPDRPGWAWRALAEQGGPADTHLEAEVRRTEDWGEVAVGASQDGGHTAGRLYGSGSVVLMDGGTHFARRVGDSFALIDAGAPGVEITVQNQLIGHTGRDGKILAAQLAPFAASRIAVVPESVPLNQDILTDEVRVRPPRDAGLVVRLTVKQTAAALIRIVNPDGGPATLGAAARFRGQDSGLIGYDGLLYLQDYQPDSDIEVETTSGTCIARTPHVESAPSFEPLATVVCRPPDRRPDGDPDRLRQPGQRAELRR